MNAKEKVQEILALADIEVNGPDPWDLQVNDERFYQRVLSHGSIGLGESYMDGWWDVSQLDEFFSKVQKARLHEKMKTFSVVWLAFKGRYFNRQAKWASKQVAREHYDLGNDLYRADARQEYAVHLRLLAGRARPGRSAGEQASPDLPQAVPQAGHEGTGTGLRIRRAGAFHGQRVRLRGGELQHLARADEVRPRVLRRAAGALRGEGLPRGGP